jgi:hypothetical protein
MNQILFPIIYTVGAAYATRTISDYVVGAAINKTTDVVVGSAKMSWNYVNHKRKPKKDIEYEYELVDPTVDDRITYVTSKMKNSDSWDPIEIELQILDRKERIRKKCVTSPYIKPDLSPDNDQMQMKSLEI